MRIRVLSTLAVAAFVAAPLLARADESTPSPAYQGQPYEGPDYASFDPPRGKPLAIEINPLSAILGMWSGSIDFMIAESHAALIVSGHYLRTHSDLDPAPDAVAYTVTGGGGELGYRWYSGLNGPRGLFVGPSFLLGEYAFSPSRGPNVAFTSIGGAVDVGYQAIISNIVIGLGAGVQYTHTTKEFPTLAYPASAIANGGLRPRVLFAVGYAF